MDKIKGLVIGVVLGMVLFSTGALCAKGENKTGFVDVKKVFDDYDKKKEFDKVLEKSVKEKEDQISKQEDEIKRLTEELEIKNEKEKLKTQEDIDEKRRKLADFKRAAQSELDRQNDKLVREIVLEINEVVKDYGQKEGYGLILKSSSILYGDPGMDITDNIVKILNENYNKREKK